MDVVSRSPFVVGSFRFRRANGRDAAAIVAKATFDLRPGECEFADIQGPLVTREVRFRDDPNASVLLASDLSPSKARADVVVIGSAYSGGAPVRSVVARVAVAEVDKAIDVHCDRNVSQHGGLREGAPFTSMPLVYERAAYDDGKNPVGMRSDRVDPLGSVRLPNLQPPGLFVQDASTRIGPIGFGPVAMAWPSRRALWTVPGEPISTRLATENIADTIDRSFFNVAPRDQQLARLDPHERLVLEHLDPEHPRLVTSLPGIAPRASIEATGADVTMVADLLVIDTDRRVCTVTWRGIVDIAATGSHRVVVVVERNGEVIPFNPHEDIVDESTYDEPSARAKARQKADTLPFRRGMAINGAITFPSASEERSSWPSTSSGATVLVPAVTASSQPAAATAFLPAIAPVVPAPIAPVAPAPVAPYAPAVRSVSEPPPARVPSHAAVVGTVAASNAAAEGGAKAQADAKLARPRTSASARPIDLIWVDAVARKRLRAWWTDLLTEAEFGEFDSRHERPTDDPEADQAMRDAVVVLTKAPATDAAELERVVDESVDDSGAFTPPLVVLEGDLKLLFDEVARLETIAAIVAPLAATDKKMKDLCDGAAQLVDGKKPPTGSAAMRHTQLIREHHSTIAARGGSSALDAEVDGALADARAYDTRDLLGSVHLRASIAAGGEAIPAYLAEALKSRLPLFDAFRARVIAEVTPRQDRGESHWLCLRVLALARIVPRRGG
jgi:hypothetical protein